MSARGSGHRVLRREERHHDLSFEIEALKIVDAVLRQHETVAYEHQRRRHLRA